MEKEGFVLMRESSAGIVFAGFMAIGIILWILNLVVNQEENPLQKTAKKLKKKEEQLKQREEKLKQIELKLKS